MHTGAWPEVSFAGRWMMWAIKPDHALTRHGDWERETSGVFTANTSTTDQELSGSQTYDYGDIQAALMTVSRA
jgi:hypothetical protein